MWKQLAIFMAIVGTMASSDPNDQNVVVSDGGSDVTLSNGIVSATFDKASARMSALKKDGGPNLLRTGYFDADTPGHWVLGHLRDAEYRLVKSDPDYAEVAFKHTDLQEFPFEVDLHYILKRGNPSGLYCFVKYQAAFEESRQLHQTRLVLRLNPTIFYYAIVSDERQATLPTPQERAAGESLNPGEAVRLADGSIDYKYLWSEYKGGHHVHGLCGDNIGVWMISASNEYVNGGPTKQNLTLHQTRTTPVLLKMLQSGHYGSGVLNFNSGEVWEKFFGPFFIYVNSGHNAAEMWTDAKRKAEAEINKWPYDWVAHRPYPLERGRVAGVLDLTDDSSPEGAWVGLGQPETPETGDTPNWQQQGKTYQFWVQADSNGRFIIPNVRAGNYTLYAFVEGVLGEFRLDGVNVVADQTTDLGRLYWSPVKNGKLLWQIGIPDRKAAEYKHGDDFRHWGLWFEYPKNFPNDVNFIIGQSDERDDWNYAHVPVKVERAALPVKEGEKTVAPDWNITFNMDDIPNGQAVLTIAIASVSMSSGDFRVIVNDSEVAHYDYTFPEDRLASSILYSDSAIPRGGIQGFYRKAVMRFDMSLLQEGVNTIALRQSGTHSYYAGIMYDCIRLEHIKN